MLMVNGFSDIYQYQLNRSMNVAHIIPNKIKKTILTYCKVYWVHNILTV